MRQSGHSGTLVIESRAPKTYGRAGTASRDRDIRTVLHPFDVSGEAYTITSGGTDRPTIARGRRIRRKRGRRDQAGRVGQARGDNQKFYFKAPRIVDGTVYRNSFQIVAKHSSKCLDVEWGSTQSGTRVQQCRCTGNSNQKWYLWRRGDKQWEIGSAQSGKCLDIYSPSGTPQLGAHLQIWRCHGGGNQALRIRSVG
ncbi:RICIN domain-containing protein [Streptomyces sp. NPDC048018]|uniref:RICIN domain-containing protein n=1 Tax=Streptomyces sp. NPDC048018 TaxID=3365499 RepID=UPI00371B28B0